MAHHDDPTGTASGTSVANVAPGATVTYTAGNNIAITQNGTQVQIATSMTPTFDSVALTTGQKLDSTGLNLNNTKVTNMAAGTAATDGVNVSQLSPIVSALGGGAAIDATTGVVTAPSYTVYGPTGATSTVNNVGAAVDGCR